MRSIPGRRLLALLSLALSLAVVAASCGDDESADGSAGSSVTDVADDADTDAEDLTNDDRTDEPAATDEPEATGDDADPAEDTTDSADGASDSADGGLEELFPDVVGATAVQDADGSWTFSATLSSPYDTPERYADAWRVIGPDGEVYGIRELTHDHANEQPFTRSQSGIEVPDGVTTVTVEGRDQVSGWGGATIEVELDG